MLSGHSFLLLSMAFENQKVNLVISIHSIHQTFIHEKYILSFCKEEVGEDTDCILLLPWGPCSPAGKVLDGKFSFFSNKSQ